MSSNFHEDRYRPVPPPESFAEQLVARRKLHGPGYLLRMKLIRKLRDVNDRNRGYYDVFPLSFRSEKHLWDLERNHMTDAEIADWNARAAAVVALLEASL